MATLAASALMGATGLQIKEITRGKPLESLLSSRIPSKAKVFPIRIIDEHADSLDFYFYKDESGDCKAQMKKDD